MGLLHEGPKAVPAPVGQAQGPAHARATAVAGAFRRGLEGVELEPAVDGRVAAGLARGRGEGPEPSALGAIGKTDRASVFRWEELREGADWARNAVAAGREREGGREQEEGASRFASTAISESYAVREGVARVNLR